MASTATQDQAKRGRGRPPKIHTAAAHDRVKPAIPHELKHFDELPNSALVRLPVVCGLFACSASAIWRNCKSGRVPQPVKLTDRVTAWRVGDLRAALAGATR